MMIYTGKFARLCSLGSIDARNTWLNFSAGVS